MSDRLLCPDCGGNGVRNIPGGVMTCQRCGGGGEILRNGDPSLRSALEAVLLFHGGGPWDDTKRLRWAKITGSSEATTKVLCDVVRAALK